MSRTHAHACPPCHPFPHVMMTRRRFHRGRPPMPPHHGPPPWVLEMIGARGRPERGEVRWLVLEALEGGPKHGYGIIQHIEERTKGAYKPSPGSIYPTLQLLEEMELVACVREGSRKLYSLTDTGRAELADHCDDVKQSYSRLGGDFGWTEAFDFHALGMRVRRTMRAIRMGVRRGRIGAPEIQRIKAVFDQALDEIEAILKGQAPAEGPAGEE
jgi:DNA-binding PadR family transcriptional regulator